MYDALHDVVNLRIKILYDICCQVCIGTCLVGRGVALFKVML